MDDVVPPAVTEARALAWGLRAEALVQFSEGIDSAILMTADQRQEVLDRWAADNPLDNFLPGAVGLLNQLDRVAHVQAN